MKTERRHELQENTLAKELNVWGEKLRPYSSAILMGLAALVACYAMLSMWNSRSESRERAAWEDYQQAMLQGDRDFRNVRKVAEGEDFAGSRMQEWAYITWADRQLRLAADDYLRDRDAVKKRLSDVVAVYDQFADEASDPDVKSRAQLGLARVSEMENRLEDAKKQYAVVEGVMAPVAAARLKELETTANIGDTVAWLKTAELPRAPLPSGGGLPGWRPDFGVTPPATEGGAADPFDPSKMLEDALGGGAAEAAAGGRYGEGAAPGTDSGATPPADGAAPATGGAEAGADAGGAAAAGGVPPAADPAPPAADPPAPTGDAPVEEAPASK